MLSNSSACFFNYRELQYPILHYKLILIKHVEFVLARVCPYGFRKCSDDYPCINEELWCDGGNDCSSGEDEDPDKCLRKYTS